MKWKLTLFVFYTHIIGLTVNNSEFLCFLCSDLVMSNLVKMSSLWWQTCDSTIPLLNELNAFFARFEAQNSTTAQKTPPPPGDQVMTLSSDSVRRSLSRINARKAPGPDNIPGRVLRDCAVELTDVFTDIFNISLNQAVVPTCFKATTIIPVPKKSSPSCFNDYLFQWSALNG